jgi:hypothetical protein
MTIFQFSNQTKYRSGVLTMSMFNLFKHSTRSRYNKAISGATLTIGLLLSTVSHGAIISSSVSPNQATLGGYSMTEFVLPSANQSLSSATSLNGDVVQFTAINASPAQSMIVGDNTNTNDAWWSGADDVFYYAEFSSVNWVELILPANTLAFALTLDSNVNANAWILGVGDDGSAVDTSGSSYTLLNDGNFSPTPTFDITLRNGVAESYGFYADNSTGSCNTLSKVVIDPQYWGMGDFSIHVDDNACEVPEPGSLWLLMVGLVGGIALRLSRRRG